MIPLYNASENPKAVTGKFLGMDRRDKGSDGAFVEMENISALHYPCLAPRGKRKVIYRRREIEGAGEILGIFPPVSGGEMEDGFSGVTDTGIYSGGKRVGIETEKENGGWFLGNHEPKTITGPVKTNSGIGNNLISFYNPIWDRMELLRVWETQNMADVIGETECGVALENLRRGMEASVGANQNTNPTATYTGVEFGKRDIGYCLFGDSAIDVQNPSSCVIEVQEADGRKIVFPAGVFRKHGDNLWAVRGEQVKKVFDDKEFDTENLTVSVYAKKIVGNFSLSHGTAPERTEQIKNVTMTVRGLPTNDWTKDYFAVGDEVEIESFTKDVQNAAANCKGWCISAQVTDVNAKLSVGISLSKSDNETEWAYASYTVSPGFVVRKIPKMIDVCIHQNRLFGAAENGRYIYASALGEFGNFYKLDGVNDNSAYFEINTPGKFIGIVSYRDVVIAFKEDSFVAIYGNGLQNYSVERIGDGIGCIDKQSICKAGGTLYFLGSDGFYAYNGGVPERISDMLGVQYDSAYGFGDETRYFASARRRDTGEYELLCFDSRYGIWTKEDNLEIVSAVFYKNKLYAATKDTVYQLDAGEISGDVEWSATGCVLYEDTFLEKGMTEIRIRARIPEDGGIRVYTAYDDGEFILQKEIAPILTDDGKPRVKVYRVPVKHKSAEQYQIRLEGFGACVVYDIERTVAVTGREMGKR